MTGKKFTEERKQFRALLRNGICKPRLMRWFTDAGLTEAEKDILLRQYLKGQSREEIARDTYHHISTICIKANKAINKLFDYFQFSDVLEKESLKQL